MALTRYTKIKLTNDRVEQSTGTTLNLSGETIFDSGSTLSILPNAATGKVLTSNTGGTATWQYPDASLKLIINQTSHGFDLLDVVGYSGTTYNKPIADGNYEGEVIGIATRIIDANNFEVTQSGYIDTFTGLTQATTYFLSDTTAGELITGQTEVVGHVVKPVLFADSTTSGWVIPFIGTIVTSGGTGGGITFEAIGDGTNVYKQTVGDTAQLRGILGSGDTTVSLSGDTILVYSDSITELDLGVTTATTTATITNSGGDDAILSGATTTYAGLVTTENQLWDGVKCAPTFSATTLCGGGEGINIGNISGCIIGTTTDGILTTLPSDTYDNYNCWVLKSSSGDTGQAITTGQDVCFIAGDNITLSRTDRAVTICAADNSYTLISEGEIINPLSTDGRLISGERLNYWAKECGFLDEVNLSVSGTTTTMTIINSGGDDAVLSGATTVAAGLVTTGNQIWGGIKSFINGIATCGLTFTDGSEGLGKILISDNSGIASWSDFPSSVTTFTGLTDTPTGYISENYVRVNSGGDALEYRTPSQVLTDISGVSTTCFNSYTGTSAPILNGAITGGTNGIGHTGRNVCLGGTLSNATSILGGGNALCLGTSASKLSTLSVNTTSNVSITSGGLLISSSGATFTDLSATPQGIKYATDYSSTYDTRSLVDKGYVDAVATGLQPHEAVKAATTTNITLSGAQSIDGISIVAGDRVLVKNQTTASQNGIYVAAAGTWSRAADFNDDPTGFEVKSGDIVPVISGNTNASSIWILTTPDPITVGTTSLEFTLFSKVLGVTAGAGITVTPSGTNQEISINLASNSGLNTTSGLSIDGSIAGSGLTWNTGVLCVNASSGGVTGIPVRFDSSCNLVVNSSDINTSLGSPITGATNIGTGSQIYSGTTNKSLQLRTLVGSGDTTVSTVGNEIRIYTNIPATTYGTLNTTCTTALSTNASESFANAICLHRVSKTGCYSHLSGTPTIPTVNDGQLSISGGTLISGGGIFTANQSTPTSITLNHETLTTTTGTTAQTATHGGTITMIDAVTGNSGHITGVRNKTVTLPAAYSHPTGFNNQPGTALTTACVISQIGVTSEGHVSGVTSRNLTTTDIGAVPTTTFNCYTGTSQPILDCAVTGATNIGTGSQIYSSKSGRNLQLRSIVGSGDTTVTTVGNNIIVHTTIPADANTYTTGVTVTGTTTKCLTLTLNNGSTVSTSFTDLDTDTITRLRGGTSGTYCSGDITICGGGDVTVGQSTSNITLTYSHPTGGVMQPSTPLTNACVISQIGVNSLGHVTGHTSRNLTAGDLGALTAVNLGPATATTYFEITNSAGTNACISGATSTYAGLVTTGNQLWAGTKCFPTFSGGTVCGATLVCGGTVRGTTICGTTISGTTVCGNTISGVSTISTCLRVTSGATTGYVLTSDASGNATWQAVPENDAVKKEITQASHGFSVGDVVGYSGTTYNKAIADGNYDGEILGIVSKVVSTSIFELTQSGYVTGLTSLSQGSTYFLSPTTAGAITATEPTTNGQVSKAVLLANSTTTGWVLPYPGYLVSTGQTGALTGVTNLGDGIGVYDSTSANVARFRSILGSGDTTVTLSGGTIIVYTDAPDGSLSGLSDTTISSPIGGDLLYYSGDTWVNYTPDAFLNNICTSAPLCAGQILVYDSLNGYWCNTNGENCFIIHGSIEETGTTINGTGALSGTGTITYITSVGGTNPTTITISHLDTEGYKHIPSGGSAGQILCYSAPGTAAWGDAPSSLINLGVTTGTTAATITNDSGGSNAILSGATNLMAGLVTTTNQLWDGIKCADAFSATTISGYTHVKSALISGTTVCGGIVRGTSLSGSTVSASTCIVASSCLSASTRVVAACGIFSSCATAPTISATTVFASSCVFSPLITGTTTCGISLIGNTLRVITGAATGCVLTSDASGNATWESPVEGVTTFTGLTDTPSNYVNTNYLRSTTNSIEYRTPAQVLSDISGISTTCFNSYTGTSAPILNGAITGATNIGTGSQIYSSTSNRVLQLRTLVGSGDTTVSTVGNDIRIYTNIPATTYGTLNTTCTTALSTNTSESFGSAICLHRVSKTGCYSHLSGTPTIPTVNNNTICISAGTGLTTGGNFTLNQNTNKTISLVHAAYTARNVSATGANIISCLISDGLGHVTSATTRTLTAGDIGAQPAGTYDNYSGWSFCAQGVTGTASIGACGTAIISGGTSITVARSLNCIGINHAAYTARNVSATGANIVSCVCVDATGHVTSATTRTLTVSDIGAQPAGTYDNYVNWCIAAGGVAGTYSVTSGGLICISGGTNVAIGRTNGTITINSTDTNTATAANNILKGSNSGTQIKYEPYASVEKAAGLLYSGTTTPTNNTRLNYDGNFHATQLYEGSTRVLTSESDPKGVASACFSGTTTKTLTLTLNDASKINASFTDCNTAYSEISTANIIATASTTTGLITGRRAHYLLNQCGLTPTAISNWNTAYNNNHSAVTLGIKTNGLSLSGQVLELDLATTTSAGAMSTADKIKLNSALVSGANLFTLKNTDVDVGEPIPQGGSLVIKGGNTVTVDRTDNELTIDATFNGLTSINEGAGIAVSGSGNSRTVAARIGSNMTWVADGANNAIDIDTSKVALKTDLHNAVTIGTKPNGLSLNGQAISLSLATTNVAGAMSAADKTILNNLSSNLFTLKSNDVEGGININQGNTLIIQGSDNVEVTRSGSTLTISANTSSGGITTLSGGIAIDVTGTGNARTISAKIDNDTIIIDELNNQMMVDSSKYATPSQLHNPVTLGTKNGLSLNNQQLSLSAATTSCAGAMSSTDKTKLNGIASNADNYGGWWLTDGTFGTGYCVTGGSEVTFLGDGSISVKRENNCITISGSSGAGTVNLGVTTATTTVTITNSAGTNAVLSAATNSRAGLVTTGNQVWAGTKCTSIWCATTRFTTSSSGVKFCGATTGCGVAGDWVATSDCRVKTNIYPISNALSTVIQLCGVNYNLCDDESNQNNVGLIAQDVEKVLPEIVSKNEPSEDDLKYGITDQKLGLKYDKLTAVLVEAIKEQQKQIEELKNKVKLLEKGI